MKYLLGVLGIGAVLGTLAFFNLTPFRTVVQQVFGATSPSGTTFNSAKVAEIVWTPTTNAASSTSILNTDSFARIITDNFTECSPFGTSAANNDIAILQIKGATTSISGQGLQGNANYIASTTLATTAPDTYIASSTEGTIFGTSRIWPSNTYLTFTANATSSTASCVTGVHYLGS